MPKDVEWLREQVVLLFEDAKGRAEPDHAICAKYAELLFKMLPQGPRSVRASELVVEEARKAVRDAL